MHGVYLLWWVQERGVSPAAVAAIIAAGDIALTALEVPTGWFADRFGHRFSLIVGSALQIIGMLLCWLGVGIPGLLAASLLVALGDAFRSGADEALLYRSCVALDCEQDFQIIQSKTRAATLVALVVLVLIGGAVVAAWGFAVGWIVETALSAAGLLIALAMVEPAAAATAESQESASSIADGRQSSAPSTGRFIAMLLPASWLGGLAGAAAFFAQTADWTTTENATVLVAIVTLAEALGAFMAGRIAANLANQFALAAAGTLVLAAIPFYAAVFFPAVVIASLLLGIAEPLRATAIQRMSADDVRARAASLAGALDKGVATIGLVIAGALPRR